MNKPLHAHIDLLSPTRLIGWCNTKTYSGKDLELVLRSGDKQIRARPNTNRADVRDHMGGEMMCGFDLALPNLQPDQMDKMDVQLHHIPTGASAIVDYSRALKKAHASPSSYQSFAPGKGSSRSEQKLAAISLPDLEGKRFLDIGCNAGFFCKYALDQGARRVVGIEAQKKFADEARLNAPGAEILNQSWAKLPDEQFDVIIMLSALHYEKDPKTFLQRILKMLSPDGIFVYEGGMASSDFTIWKTVHRGVGSVKYPSKSLLQNHLFEGFAYRYVGPSVNQPGDPLNRHVYHASPKLPIWTILRGKGRAGKSSLAASLGRGGTPNIMVDRMLTDQWLQRINTGVPILDDYMRLVQPRNLGSWVDGIESDKLAHAVAHYLAESLPTECDCVAEGYVFSNDKVFEAFKKLAARKRVRLWAADREA